MLFTFDSIPFKNIKIVCESENPINVIWNRQDLVEKREDENATWIINQPGCLESLEIRTTSHDATALRFFSISIE
uniref:Uncharacterized protein n=1 Tax=Caenorhabditis japonica TaxID=281687 RepID=A0A8R1IPA3_CAEJA